MGLQLRMAHSLGQRLVEVEARSADDPIVVGRGADAQVQIPSAGIARRHCLLFVYEGRWVVQDAGSPGGTFLNGERIGEPAYINSGDVIKLGGGSGPPSLLVDPHSIGVSEDVDEAAPAPIGRSAPVPAPAPNPVSAPPLRAAPRPSAPGLPMPPPLVPPPAPAAFASSFIVENDSDQIDAAPAFAAAGHAPAHHPHSAVTPIPGYRPPVAAADEWGAPASTVPAAPRPKRAVAPRGNSPAMLAGVAVVSIVIAVVGGVWIYNNYRRANEAGRPDEAARQPAEQHKKSGSIFDFQPPAKGTKTSDGDQPGSAAHTPPDRRAVSRAVPTTRQPVAPTDAAASDKPEMNADDQAIDDPEWSAVERARRGGDPVLAIVKFEDYAERFPGNKNKKDLAQYTDEALDLLWWKRLSELFAERDDARKKIAARKQDISQAQDPNFKKELEKEIARFTETRDNVDSIIHDQMKFTGETPPNLYDNQLLAIARKSRDAKYYEETWKPQVLRTIKSSRGQRLPWRNSR